MRTSSAEHNALKSSPSRRLSFDRINERRQSGRIFTFLLFAVIVVFLFFLLLFSVTVYQTVNDSRVGDDERRLALSLIANTVRAQDVVGAVGVGEGPEGKALVLVETLEGTAYETRLYTFEGVIVQEYAFADAPYTPERAREVVRSSIFEFSYNEGLLTVETDHGVISIALRSMGEGV